VKRKNPIANFPVGLSSGQTPDGAPPPPSGNNSSDRPPKRSRASQAGGSVKASCLRVGIKQLPPLHAERWNCAPWGDCFRSILISKSASGLTYLILLTKDSSIRAEPNATCKQHSRPVFPAQKPRPFSTGPLCLSGLSFLRLASTSECRILVPPVTSCSSLLDAARCSRGICHSPEHVSNPRTGSLCDWRSWQAQRFFANTSLRFRSKSPGPVFPSKILVLGQGPQFRRDNFSSSDLAKCRCVKERVRLLVGSCLHRIAGMSTKAHRSHRLVKLKRPDVRAAHRQP